jgi:hypothetical protein
MGLKDRLIAKGYEIGRAKARDNLKTAVMSAEVLVSQGFSKRIVFQGSSEAEIANSRDEYFRQLMRQAFGLIMGPAKQVYQNEGEGALRQTLESVDIGSLASGVSESGLSWNGKGPLEFMQELSDEVAPALRRTGKN